jgi:hypothetical protein
MITNTWRLIKESDPGWKKHFSTKDDCIEELLSHICDMCRDGDEWHDPLSEWPDLPEILSTSCGCEFSVLRPGET